MIQYLNANKRALKSVSTMYYINVKYSKIYKFIYTYIYTHIRIYKATNYV